MFFVVTHGEHPLRLTAATLPLSGTTRIVVLHVAQSPLTATRRSELLYDGCI